ncbi:MAG TPA: HAD family hydrolase [Candidatus Paceibacterota bacterium]|nr:HAD family hydrolase [Candidatus Paceibacterota bacterium]
MKPCYNSFGSIPWVRNREMEGAMRIQPKRVRAVIFDYDGPLSNSFNHGLRMLATLARKRGLAFTPRIAKRLIRTWGLKGNELIAKAFGISLDEGTVLYREWSEAEKLTPCGLVPMARETLQDLRERGLVNTILTSRPSWALAHSIDAEGIKEHFAHIVTTCDTEFHKPHPRSFDCTMELLGRRGVREDECVFIGDTFVDIDAGRARGVTTFIVRTGPYAFFDHKDFDPDHMIPSVGHLVPRLRDLNYSL